MNLAEEVSNSKGETLKIYYDDNYEEDYDRLGVRYCSHKRYNLGDVKINNDNFNSWEEVRNSIRYKCVLPLYLYDHSGLAVSTSRFSCPWDSGQIGFIYCSMANARKYGCKNQESALKHLEAEVKTWNDVLGGQVYGFELMDPQGQATDSCWGFIGSDHDKSGLFECAGWEKVA